MQPGWHSTRVLNRTSRPIRACDAVVMECAAIAAPVLRASILWLATESASRGVDAVIVVASLDDANTLACTLPARTLCDLIAGNVVRMNGGSLQLLLAHEVMPQARRHQAVLAIGLTAYDLERVKRMRPAALCTVRVNPRGDRLS